MYKIYLFAPHIIAIHRLYFRIDHIGLLINCAQNVYYRDPCSRFCRKKKIVNTMHMVRYIIIIIYIAFEGPSKSVKYEEILLPFSNDYAIIYNTELPPTELYISCMLCWLTVTVVKVKPYYIIGTFINNFATCIPSKIQKHRYALYILLL